MISFISLFLILSSISSFFSQTHLCCLIQFSRTPVPLNPQLLQHVYSCFLSFDLFQGLIFCCNAFNAIAFPSNLSFITFNCLYPSLNDIVCNNEERIPTLNVYLIFVFLLFQKCWCYSLRVFNF